MPRLFLPYGAEVVNAQNHLERQRRVEDTVNSTDAQTAMLMTQYARMFPSTPAGITRSLSLSRVPPDSPVAHFAITQNQFRLLQTHGSWEGTYGRPQRPTLTEEERRDLETRKRQAFRQYEAATTTNTQMQDLMKEAERRGTYSPSTGMLVEPDADAPEADQKFFSDLANKIYTLSGDAVPFVQRTTGAIMGWDPGVPAGRYPIDPTTGKNIDLSDPAFSRQMPTRTEHVEPGEPLAELGVDSYQFTELGEPLPQSEASVAASEALIAQIYADNEARAADDVPDSVNAAVDRVHEQRAGITPSDPGGTFLRQPIRLAAMIADAPLQEAQGLVRNIRGAFHGEDVNWLESQSDLGIVLPRAVSNILPGGEQRNIDIGAGFMTDPDSQVARERRQREAQRGQIGGHNITAGRWLADQVTEPDTKPFAIMSGLTDAAVQVVDPTAYALGKVGEVGVAMRTFQPDEAAGTFSTFRQFFHGPTAERWLDDNTKLVEWLSDTRDPFEIGKRTNFKLEPELTANLAGANNTKDIRGILTGAIERGRIRKTTELEGTLVDRIQTSWSDMHRVLKPSYSPRSVRMFQTMPSAVIDLEDSQQTAQTLMNVIHNAHGSEEDLRTAYNAVATAKTPSGLRTAVHDVFGLENGPVANALRHYGVNNDEVISYLLRVHKDTYNEDLRGLIDEVGADVPTWEHMTVGGQTEMVSGPHLPMEHISRYVQLPDQRAIRRLTTKYPFLTAADTADFFPGLKPLREHLGFQPSLSLEKGEPGRLRLPFAFMDSAMSKVLKPAWLLRLAWPVRVIGEEQLRMATAGLDSAFSGHPLSWIALAIGTPDSKLASLLNRITPGIEPAATLDAAGEVLNEVEELGKVTYRAHGAWLDAPGTVRTNLPSVFTKNSVHELTDFRHAWANEITLLNYDPVSNFVANHTMDESIEWLFRGPGKKFRAQLGEAHPGNLLTRDQVRNYITTVSERIHRISGGDADVLEMIKTGKFNRNVKGVQVPTPLRNGLGLDTNLSRHLDNFIDAAPTKLKGSRFTAQHLQQNFGQQWNGVVDRMMAFLMGTPTSTLSRAPAFKQYLWKRVGELMPYADEEAQLKILANAEKANLSGRQMRYLSKQAERATGKLSHIEVNDLAKGYALDDTKGLLYDVSEKGQASDILRNIAPFAEAWKEVIGRWSSLMITRGGKPARRLQQIIEGARGEALGDFLGNPGDQGFFYTNEFGEEVFAYPGSQWLMNKETNLPGPLNLPGVPVPMTGRVQGLNMFGSIMPSLGPVAQIPVAFFLQDKPDLDWVRKQLLPFGGPGAEDTSTIFDIRDYLPGYMKTAVDWFTKGGTDDRVYASSVMYVAAYLHSTGEYGNSVAEQQRLMEDAKDKAHDLYSIRAIGQFMLPAAPSPNWLINDKSGNLLSQRILAEQFYADVSDSGDYQATVQEFLDKYGTEAIGAIIPHSRSIIPNVPTTVKAATWVADHPDVKSSFPLTYGLFAPSGGEFDMTTYVRNFISEERDAITPDQWEMLRDNTLANHYYENEIRKLGPDADSPSDAQAKWLRDQRAAITEAFPQWGNRTGLDERPETDILVRDLYRAADDPYLSTTEAGKALKMYLTQRDKAQQQAESMDLASFRTSKRLSGTRTWLRSQAEALVEQYPAFKQIYDFVLSRELVED